MADATLDLLRRTAGDTGRRVLIRGGSVVTMDEDVGDFVGDVLLEGSTIVAVGHALADDVAHFDGVVVEASGAIVMPGLVDSHVHAWQAALSGLIPDVTLPRYLALVHGFAFGAPTPPGLAAGYAPEDMRIANLVTSLRCIDTGVTCFVDNCHNTRTPEHADAAIEGLRDAQIRAVHASGAPLDGTRADDWMRDALRLRDEVGAAADGLVTLRLFADPDPAVWSFAREHGLWVSCETGAWVERALDGLWDEGLLGDTHTFNHCAALSDDMWSKLGQSGSTVNVCARSDTSYLVGAATPPLAEATAHHVPVGLSMDTEVGYRLDMFAEMRALLQAARSRAAPIAPGEDIDLVGTPDVLRVATSGGAANAGLSDVIGTLAPGKAADVLVIRPGGLSLTPAGNVISRVVSFGTPADVDAVFVAGQPRKWGGEILDHQLGSVLDELAASRERIIHGFGASIAEFHRPAFI